MKKAAWPSRHVLEEWIDLGPLKESARWPRRSSSGPARHQAPWLVVSADDPAYRDLLFGRTIRTALEKRRESPPPLRDAAPALAPSLDDRTVLDALDLARQLDRNAYAKRLVATPYRLTELTDPKAFDRTSLVYVYEGSDAAGKGGPTRRFAPALDPRRCRVWPIAATPPPRRSCSPTSGASDARCRGSAGRPSSTRPGMVGCWWSGSKASPAPEWLRTYREINRLEAELTRHGAVVVRFWIAISPEEQLRRFEARADTA